MATSPRDLSRVPVSNHELKDDEGWVRSQKRIRQLELAVNAIETRLQAIEAAHAALQAAYDLAHP